MNGFNESPEPVNETTPQDWAIQCPNHENVGLAIARFDVENSTELGGLYSPQLRHSWRLHLTQSRPQSVTKHPQPPKEKAAASITIDESSGQSGPP
jgi:hypothetical protein